MSIVVGFIQTKEGRAAVEAAVAESRLRGNHLIVVVSRPRGSADMSEQVVQLRQRLVTDGIDHEIRTQSRESDPADDLIRVAEEVAADLIVIGLRRRTPVGKLILGSSAQRVLLDATCPVLAVKA